MAFDPSISPLLTSINVADTESYDLAASSNVIGSSTYNTDVLWGGLGGTFTIITTGNLASLAQIETRGLLAVKTVGSGLVTALITEGNGISVEESGNDFLVSVIPNSTTQLVTGQCNGDSADSPKNKINLVAGANVSITLSETSDALNWTINASGGGGGGDASEWSTFPATQDVDMDEFSLINVEGVSLSGTVDSNTTFGYLAGENLTSPTSGNVILGANAGAASVGSSGNVFIGRSAGATGTTTVNSVFIGDHAGVEAVGPRNVGIGTYALSLVTDTSNVGIGYEAGRQLTSGGYNTLIGTDSGVSLTEGSQNICIGFEAALGLSTGSNNIIFGMNGSIGETASTCIVMGSEAGGGNATESTAVGPYAKFDSYSQATAIGYSAECTADNQVMLGDPFEGTVVVPNLLSIPLNASNGYVLTSNAEGLASWQASNPTPPSISITTVDATPTNIEVIEVLEGDCVTVTGNVVGLDAASTDACGGNFSITAFQSSGVVTLVSPPVAILSTTSTATFNVNVDAGSGFIILTVTGLVGTNYNWKLNYNVLNLNA